VKPCLKADGVAVFEFPYLNERGIRWSEPAFKFEWPFEPVVISARDRTYADFVP
jgi:dTDP-4-dehydrorhamnose 3,5-epimerase-like enzyme